MIKKIKKLFNKVIEIINRYSFWIALLFMFLATLYLYIDAELYLDRIHSRSSLEFMNRYFNNQ